MFQKYFTNFPYIKLVIVGELLFLAIFLFVIFWIFRNGSHAFYKTMSTEVLGLEKETDSGYKR